MLVDQQIFSKIAEDYVEDPEEIKDWSYSIIYTL